jgi:uncharacterized membrane protein
MGASPKGWGFIDLLSALVVLGLCGGAGAFWALAPEGRYPAHMNLLGQVDRWADHGEFTLVLSLMAGLSALLAGFMAWAVRSATLARQVEKAGPLFSVARVIVVLAPAFGAALMAGVGLGLIPAGDPILMFRVIMAFVALTILAVGEPMGKTKPNAVAGVRTYFTLTSRQAWDKSNRLGGRLFFWIGLVGLILSPFAPQPAGLALLAGLILASVIWTLIEGWRVWRSDPERREAI